MRSVWTIFKKEIWQFFSAPISYVVIAVFLAVSGFLFYNIASYFAMQCIQALQYQSAYNIPLLPMSVNQWVVRPFFHNIAIMAIFLIPIVTMRSYAAERAFGTAELLMTSPLRTAHLVFAKFAGALALYLALIAGTLLFLVVTHYYSIPAYTAPADAGSLSTILGLIKHFFTAKGLDWNPVVSGYLGLILLGIAAIPIGQFISSLTKNQIISAFLTFSFLLILWIVDWSTLFSEGLLSKIIGYVGLAPHFGNFAKGVIDTSDFIYFVSVAILGVFLTYQSIESWRWKGA